MKNTKKIILISIFVMGILSLGQSKSHALIVFEGDMGLNSLGSYEGSLSYNPGTKELTVSLTNTSPVLNGGYLTGFVFNNPGGNITGVSTYTPSDPDFTLLGTPTYDNNVGGAPFGQFDIGAALGGNFLGGGSPTAGIGVGDTESFIFQFTGTNLGTLIEQYFLNELSTAPFSSGQGAQNFVARFRGFEDGGSDKVPLNPNSNAIPEPATMLLFGSGMVGMVLRRRKKT